MERKKNGDMPRLTAKDLKNMTFEEVAGMSPEVAKSLAKSAKALGNLSGLKKLTDAAKIMSPIENAAQAFQFDERPSLAQIMADSRDRERKYKIETARQEELARLEVRAQFSDSPGGRPVSPSKMGGEVVQLHAVPVDAEPSTYPELLNHYLKANKNLIEAGSKQKSYTWTPKRRAILASEKERRQGQSGVARDMARDFSMSVTNLNNLIRRKDEGASDKSDGVINSLQGLWTSS